MRVRTVLKAGICLFQGVLLVIAALHMRDMGMVLSGLAARMCMVIATVYLAGALGSFGLILLEERE